ncbi:hypothetical protein Y032_0107g3835 [Ancylostoma ceylanicum]|uniref:Uncharacterized protein n=1 Tax=Ancylostoma ceylanicum TaxID=53326 RepID=A0A016TFM4_9BILA|nr:hypothetical protein Y032_0107g3835 [Ancylostoma ceylanicum]
MTLRKLSAGCVNQRYQAILTPGCVYFLIVGETTPTLSPGCVTAKNTLTSRYFVKLCDDINFCNNYCNPEVTVEPPQRQPTISCYECESFGGECFTGQCIAQYCLYQRQRRRSTGTTYVKKSCTNAPFVEYPDNTPSTALNSCETRTINDIQYQVRVCNSGNNCNVACPIQDEQLLTCYQCESTNQPDCTTGSCRGKYCLFTRAQSSVGTQIKKGCSNSNELLYPDNASYASLGICEYRQINSINYDYKLCNSSSYCNTVCPSGPFTSTTVSPLLPNLADNFHLFSFAMSMFPLVYLAR